MSVIHEIEKAQLKSELPQFKVGDTVRVHFRIVEGEKERVQIFEGVVISRKGGEGLNARFTVRRVAYSEGVERVFPLHSPRVERVEVVREGHVRRAKLHYLRERSGKRARVKAKARSAGRDAIMADAEAVEPAGVEAAAEAEAVAAEDTAAQDDAESTAAVDVAESPAESATEVAEAKEAESGKEAKK